MSWSLPGKGAPKVGICIPFLGDVRAEWSFAFAQLVRSTQAELALYMNKHFAIDYSRNDLVEMALKEGCTHVMFLDSDIYPYRVASGDAQHVQLVPYPTVVDYLLYQEYPIVSGLYWTKRGFPNLMMRTADDYAPQFLTGPLLAFAGRHLYVNAVGIGCCLVDARVFRRIPYPWFNYLRSKDRGPDGKFKEISEDIYFGYKAMNAGFSVLALGDLLCKHGHHVFDRWDNESEASLENP